MVTPEGRPSVARRQLGRRLRILREGAGKTADDVATTGIASRTKTWRIEHGPRLAKDVAEQRIDFRLYRQRAFFDRPAPGRMDAVITAGALNLQVGSALVMEAQREHLRGLADRDGVSIRILPADNGLHPRMTGAFTIFDFDDPDDPSVVCVENVIETRYFDRTDHVARFREEFELVRAKAVPVEDYLR